jgi:ABC-2 type transport system permease protein
MFRFHVILAVFRRNVLSFFSSMLGYLFIIAFVLAGAFAAFDDEFFANNEASLDQLTEWYPVLLVFMVPAITMSIWSDEKKLGTDELLFTLPGADWEILLGKYLAALFTYTVIVAFSFSHAIVLAWIGDPDWGLIASTFIGYWAAGMAMIAIGMFASVLTSSATVAFVLGAIFCAVPVFIDMAPGMDTLKVAINFREPLSIGGNLDYFSLGMVPVNGLIYFGLLTAFFLYLNAVVVARRHWGGSPWGISYGWQYAVRVTSLAVVVISLSFIGAKAAGMRLDFTEENLFTLTETTLSTLERIDAENPVTIDAYITPSVPEEYLQVQKNLYGVLRQLDRKAGSRVRVRIVDTEPATKEAEEARTWGIEPVTRDVEERGRLITSTIFMGAVVRSGYDQVVIPFFDKGTPVEYELTRSIGTALKDERLVLGILETRAELIGPERSTATGSREREEWRIVAELRKQYAVKSVSAAEPIEEAFDVLLAVMPSTLENNEIQNLTDYVKSGRPVLVVLDSYPTSLRYLELFPGLENLRMGMGAPQDKPALNELMRTLGVTWKKEEVVFDTFNPHPIYQERFPPEYMFLTSERPNREEPCLNQESPITRPFREVLLLFSGHIGRDPSSNLDFEPLLRTRRKTTGVEDVNEMFVWSGGFPGMGQPMQRDDLPHPVQRQEDYIVGARISSKDKNGVNAIVLADLDMIGDSLFDVWEQQFIDLSIDNVLLTLNCVDALAGNDSYLALRGRYRRQRKLDKVELRREVFQRNLTAAIQEAREEATKKIKSAEERLQEELTRIEQNTKLDRGEKERQKAMVSESQGRLVQQEIERIQRETNARVRSERIEANEEIKKVENLVRIQALFIPPLLPLAVGLMVLGLRILGEQRGIAKERMVKGPHR